MNKTIIPKGTARWMYIPFVSPEHIQEISAWIEACGIDVKFDGVIIHPVTFKQMLKWFVMTEENKVIFLLKWCGNVQ